MQDMGNAKNKTKLKKKDFEFLRHQLKQEHPHHNCIRVVMFGLDDRRDRNRNLVCFVSCGTLSRLQVYKKLTTIELLDQNRH
jgi:hypothetical protein